MMRSILDLAALNVLKNNLSVTIDKFSDHLIEGFLKLMSKVNLNNITAGYGSVDLLNENFDAIAEAFDNTLSRNGAVPNTWLATQDANHQRLINLADPIDGKDAVNKEYVINAVVDATPIAFVKAAYYVDRFTGDGSDTTFTLTAAPGLGTNSQVYINGAYQNKNTYSVSGTTITFTEAPPLDSSIECVVVTPVAPEVNAAANITIADAGGYYTSGNVEGALQEVGADIVTAQTKLSQIVSVKDFGAVGDGVTDDTTAIQNALDSGAKRITVPQGIYVTGPLTIPSWVELVGETFPDGIAAGLGPVTFKFSLTSGTAIDCGDNTVIRNIAFQNVGGSYNDTTDVLSGTTAICIQTNNNVTLDECSFSFWYECINLGGGPYYTKTNRIWFNRCTYGYRANTVAAYNLDITEPKSSKTDIFFSGSTSTPSRNIKVFGGSIEGYSVIAEDFNDISFFGTYFETVATREGAFAITPGVDGCAVSLFGCLVYMNHTARFVNMGGFTRCMLTSVGNVFDGVAPASSYIFYLPDDGSVHLAGDRFGNGHPSTCRYITPEARIGQFNISMPLLPAGNAQVALSHAFSCGQQGMIMYPLTAAPTNKVVGMMVLANGVSWDPLSRAAGRPYWTVWQGDRWYSISG